MQRQWVLKEPQCVPWQAVELVTTQSALRPAGVALRLAAQTGQADGSTLARLHSGRLKRFASGLRCACQRLSYHEPTKTRMPTSVQPPSVLAHDYFVHSPRQPNQQPQKTYRAPGAPQNQLALVRPCH